MRSLLRKKVTWAALAFVVAVVTVGLWAFQPWKLWTRSEVNEALPSEFAVAQTTTPPPTSPSPTETATTTATTAATTTVTTTTTSTPAGPTVLAEGEFVTQEHETRGTARVLSSGGTRILRLEGFSTSDGPDLHIWLSDATAGGEWGKYDDGRYVRLGAMKATDGNQNYAIPADADLAGLRSVVVWCDRFNVAFGSAPLDL
ncbi:DM13 domain-containing protein [Actinokineospora guangxiensis]|uniref:DM13 domain-containing protein n=1 Tax=Actinokineospora guangxiensis TaxID=1490288 RepID=A0ABW0EGS9_9PSEU